MRNRNKSTWKTVSEAAWIAVSLMLLADPWDFAGAVKCSAAGEDAVITEDFYEYFLPETWDPREQGTQPAVKSQGSYGTCWALAATSALEAALLPDTEIVFSADHMALNNKFNTELSDGGDYVMIMAYLSGWQGPVTEEEDPYGDGVSPEGLEPAVHVQEIQLLELDETDTAGSQVAVSSREKIKKAVIEYGAVQTSLYMSRAETSEDQNYYNKSASAYYYPAQMQQNHDVIILGWDDHFSRFHFKQVPPEDGAFICQNSWGSSFGENGIFYVSYADANIGRTGLVYSRVEPTDNYDMIYQTDDCGWQGQQGYASDTCWFANVYTAGQQELAAYGFYATGADTSYELYLTRDFDGTESFSDMEFLQAGTLELPGYYTIDLEEPVELTDGERFAVMVKITTPGSSNPVAVEYQADSYTQNVETDGKEGYLSRNGKDWEHTEQKFGSNVCLKAYATDAKNPGIITFSLQNEWK